MPIKRRREVIRCHDFHPYPREVVLFDVLYPLLSELQWRGNIILMRIKCHAGCLINKRADELAEADRTADEPELCPRPQKWGSFWLRINYSTSELWQ
jgi:hypothetical protein